MPQSGGAKPLEWARAARDPFAARLVVENALTQIQAYPRIGRPAGARGRRAFPIPNTGHIINYRETKSAIRVLRWYRGKQNVPR